MLNDVLNDKVSPDAARREYGVVIDLQRMTVDFPATEEMRLLAMRSAPRS